MFACLSPKLLYVKIPSQPENLHNPPWDISHTSSEFFFFKINIIESYVDGHKMSWNSSLGATAALMYCAIFTPAFVTMQCNPDFRITYGNEIGSRNREVRNIEGKVFLRFFLQMEQNQGFEISGFNCTSNYRISFQFFPGDYARAYSYGLKSSFIIDLKRNSKG